MVSTIKHYALNDQESGRGVLDARISEAAARESDLLAFEIAIAKGRPGSAQAQAVSAYWVAFAKTGNPNDSGRPAWWAF